MTGATAYLPIIVGVIAFVLISLFFFGVFRLVWERAKKTLLIGRIQESAEGARPFDAFESSQQGGAVQSRVLNFLGMVGKRTGSKKDTDYSQRQPLFLKAGIRWRNAPAAFWGAKIILAVLLPIGFLVIRAMYPQKMLFSHSVLVLIGVCVAVAGFYLPNLWLFLKTRRRKEVIREGFADALDLLTVCVEAGMGLDSAITRVAREMQLDNKTLSGELHLMNLEMRGGKARRDALKNLAMRTDVEDINSLATLLIQADKLGTGIGQALRVFSESFRTKRYQRAEEAAAKIPVKLLIPLILFVFPTLLITIMGPAAIRIYKILLPVLGGK
ncbi:MAG: type II secretion system F family protein [Deltaproteobacteria bacterium]|nr:type II secretion system F family protein [Deltaproteobacteria bacterium]